ncbi:hypothetical protein QQ045_019917 [Rhodiola kirilowii]
MSGLGWMEAGRSENLTTGRMVRMRAAETEWDDSGVDGRLWCQTMSGSRKSERPRKEKMEEMRLRRWVKMERVWRKSFGRRRSV